MRKEQEKILEKAKKKNLVNSQMKVLSRENFSIVELKAIFDYFIYQPSSMDGDLLSTEAVRCVEYLKKKKAIILSVDYTLVLKAFLDSSYKAPADALIGNNKKKRILKMYSFIRKHGTPSYRGGVNHVIFGVFVKMLREQIPVWNMNIILRAIFQDEDKCGIYWKTQDYPCLMNDFIANGKESMYYHLAIEKDYVSKFAMSEKELDRLYNRTDNRFTFTKEEVDNIFVFTVNEYGKKKCYLNHSYLLGENPISDRITCFCRENGLKEETKWNNVIWDKWELVNPENKEVLFQCYSLLGKQYNIEIPTYHLNIVVSSNYFITINYAEYKHIVVGVNNSNGWCVTGSPSNTWDITISPDGYLFSKIKKTNKLIPLRMAHFVKIYQFSNLLGECIKQILAFHVEKNRFYKDVIDDFISIKPSMPLSFNEVGTYYNRADLMAKKYKTSLLIPIKWNKMNLNLSYLIVKAYKLVEARKSRQILIQQRDINSVNRSKNCHRTSERIYEYLSQVIVSQIYQSEIKKLNTEELRKKYLEELSEEMKSTMLPDEQEEWLQDRVKEELNNDVVITTARDYINMCRQSKSKIRLDIYTLKQLEKIHGRIATESSTYRKDTKEVNIPKDTRFAELRKILPPEFEWIKTRKRLILETELQHHCVWSYAPDITEDKCAIYSFTDSRAEYTTDGISKRYTIEFRQNKDKSYYVVQVQGRKNRANTDGMKEYIQSLLNQYSKKYEEEKKYERN